MSEGILRVLVVEPCGNLWGSERALLDLCQGLEATNCSVGICCPPNTPIIAKISAQTKLFPTFISNLHRKARFCRIVAAFRLWRAIRRFKPDLVYVNQTGATKVAILAAKAARLPVVSHVRLLEDVAYVEKLWKSSGLSHVICISKFIENAFSEGMRSSIHLHTIFDGYIPSKNAAFKDSFKNSIVCPGRFAHVKGQDILINAAKDVHLARPNTKIRIVGRSNCEDSFDVLLQQLRRNLGLDGMIAFEPFADNVVSLLESADFMVCPSRVEPLGRVVFEAWDAGVIPIAYRGSGGPAETISSAHAGILYDSLEPGCLAEAILNAYNLPVEVRRGMVERGREWIGSHLDPIRYAKEVVKVFESAIAGARFN